jgi:hypothetical protein
LRFRCNCKEIRRDLIDIMHQPTTNRLDVCWCSHHSHERDDETMTNLQHAVLGLWQRFHCLCFPLCFGCSLLSLRVTMRGHSLQSTRLEMQLTQRTCRHEDIVLRQGAVVGPPREDSEHEQESDDLMISRVATEFLNR